MTSHSLETAGSINICGLLVHAHLKDAQRVQDALENYAGVEVHKTTEDGRMVVTIDKDDPAEMVDIINNIQAVDGVLSAAMVYQHHE